MAWHGAAASASNNQSVINEVVMKKSRNGEKMAKWREAKMRHRRSKALQYNEARSSADGVSRAYSGENGEIGEWHQPMA
jgi:hypothetical protein